MGKRTRVLAALATGLLVAVLGAQPAWASGADTTPPILNLSPLAAFPRGSQIGVGNSYGYTGMPMYISWQGYDASQICGYDLSSETDYYELYGSSVTRYDFWSGDYDGSYGGPPDAIDWTLTAHDCAGNTTTKSAFAHPDVLQESGASLVWPYRTERMIYTGAWATSHCTCYSGGTDRYTTQKGAAATLTVRTRAANAPMGLVMEEKPQRGKFTLFIDGVNRGTVDTYAPAPTEAVVVWTGRMTTAGTHAIKLVNLATVGRPRIDLDAVLIND